MFKLVSTVLVLFAALTSGTFAVPVIQGSASPAMVTNQTKAADVEVIGGFVLFRYDEATKIFEFLLVEKASEPGDWSPPKGHVESGEVPVDAAYREMREETSLVAEDYDVLFGLHEHFEYETSNQVQKIVDLWPARLTALDYEIILSEENSAYTWAETDQCLQIVKQQYKQAFVNIIQNLFNYYNKGD